MNLILNRWTIGGYMVKLTKVLEDVVFTSNTDSKGFDDIEIVDIAYSSLKCQ